MSIHRRMKPRLATTSRSGFEATPARLGREPHAGCRQRLRETGVDPDGGEMPGLPCGGIRQGAGDAGRPDDEVGRPCFRREVLELAIGDFPHLGRPGQQRLDDQHRGQRRDEVQEVRSVPCSRSDLPMSRPRSSVRHPAVELATLPNVLARALPWNLRRNASPAGEALHEDGASIELDLIAAVILARHPLYRCRGQPAVTALRRSPSYRHGHASTAQRIRPSTGFSFMRCGCSRIQATNSCAASSRVSQPPVWTQIIGGRLRPEVSASSY